MKKSILCIFTMLPLLVSCTNQSNIDALNARVMQHERQINQLSSQVGSVEQVLPGQAEMWAQMQSMRQELNQLRGSMDEFQMRAGANSQSELARLKVATERLEIALRQMTSELGMNIEALNTPAYAAEDPYVQQGEGSSYGSHHGETPNTDSNPYRQSGVGGANTAGSVLPYGTNDTTSGTNGMSSAPSGDTATTLYDSGMKAFSDRRYKDAVVAFDDFAKNFPNHQLTSNAYFWKGESYYQQSDYGRAAVTYQEVIEKFPGSNKFQSAMLKQGQCFFFVGKKDASKLRLEELATRYPNSPEAGRAKKFIKDNKL